MTQLQPGEQLGPYQIVSQVGKGGMATVYKAFHAPMNRYVAVKVLPEQLTDQPQFIERFRQEAQTIANLQHPHILPVFDYGESNGRMYLVMRYLDSGTLKERMQARPLTLKEIDRFFSQLLDALGYAHAQNVVHRDLKPSNALVDSQDNLFLTDFGIAKVLERQTHFTETGALMGTPDYMSPEQAKGVPVDQRSDIYSLGIILYEMVTGRVPFEAETPLAVILKHISDPLPPPTTIRPGLEPAIERVILKALAKTPEDRFANCNEFLQAWKEALAEAAQTADIASPIPRVEAVSPKGTATTTASGGRNDTWLAVGCFGALAVVACLLIAAGAWAVSSLNLGQVLSATGAATSASTQGVNTPGIITPGVIAASTTTPKPDVRSTPEGDATLPPDLPRTPTAAPGVEAFNVSNNPRESEYPDVAVDDAGNVHVLWADRSLKPEGDVFYRQQNAAGEWSEVQALTTENRNIVGSSLRWIQNPDGQWCALWYAVNWNLRCLKDGKFSTAERLRTDVSWGDDPAFAYAPDGSLKIAHVEFSNVMFGEAQVSDGFNTIHDLRMVLDSDGNPHVVWIEHASSDFIVNDRYSPDGGKTWNDIETLSDADTHANLGSPIDLAADSVGGGVHLVWQSSPFGNGGGFSYYRRWSADSGWGPAVELPDGQPLTEMSIATDAEGQAHIVAAGLVGSGRGIMVFEQSADGSWSPARLIAEDPGSGSSSRYPQIFVDSSGGRHIVWQSPDSQPEIYYARLGQ